MHRPHVTMDYMAGNTKIGTRMKNRPNRVRKIWNFDWHTRLCNQLKLAQTMTASPQLRNTMQLLEQQLAETDECVHTVTAVLPASTVFSGEYLFKLVQENCDVEPSEVCLKSDGSIAVTLTARGPYSHVLSMAEAILSAGVTAAESKVLADDWNRKYGPFPMGAKR